MNNNIYVDRYDYKNIKDLLNEILNKVIIYNKINGTTPAYIKMTANQYYDIRKYKPDLIKYNDGNYYILCMKVVL